MSCLRCGRPMFRDGNEPPPPDSVRVQSRSLCQTCHYAITREGRLDEYPPLVRRNEDVIEDYRIVLGRKPDMRRAEIAAEMGMTHAALDKAIERARKAGVRV